MEDRPDVEYLDDVRVDVENLDNVRVDVDVPLQLVLDRLRGGASNKLAR